jgi:hypothetical protein
LKRVAALFAVLLVLGGGVYLYLPRSASLSATVAATLSILNTDISAKKGAADFTPGLDGQLLASGDLVKSSANGRAVLTFFDGSILTVDVGSVVRVTTLNRLSNGGIQLVIEQTLGRTWASVSKLTTPDSKFEIRTPTSQATVRGTAFETLVEQRPDGTVSVSYKTDEGEVVVTANAGGQTSVTAGTQVTIGQGQPAPAAATPIAPTTSLRVTSSIGIGFALTAPSGATCASTGSKAEIFGCVTNGTVVTIREPVAGRYAVMMAAAAATPGATLKVEALRGSAVEATQMLTRTFASGDLIRSGFSYGSATQQTVSALELGEQISSVCGAQATGRVFSTGAVDERFDQLRAFSTANRNQPVSIVVTDAELLASVQRAVADGGANSGPVLRNVGMTIDRSGLHFTGGAVTAVGTFNGSADAIAGPVDGKLNLKLRSLTVTPLPSPVLDQIQSDVQKGLDEFSASFPMVVRRVALRPGCLAVMGSTR